MELFVSLWVIISAVLYVINAYIKHLGGPEAGWWEPLTYGLVGSVVLTLLIRGALSFF